MTARPLTIRPARPAARRPRFGARRPPAHDRLGAARRAGRRTARDRRRRRRVAAGGTRSPGPSSPFASCSCTGVRSSATPRLTPRRANGPDRRAPRFRRGRDPRLRGAVRDGLRLALAVAPVAFALLAPADAVLVVTTGSVMHARFWWPPAAPAARAPPGATPRSCSAPPCPGCCSASCSSRRDAQGADAGRRRARHPARRRPPASRAGSLREPRDRSRRPPDGPASARAPSPRPSGSAARRS